VKCVCRTSEIAVDVELVTGDTLSVYVENIGGTKDLDAETLSLTL